MRPQDTGKPIEILLVEDNPGDARLIREWLGEAVPLQFHLTQAATLSAGLQRLERQTFDLLLLDLDLPDSRGFDTFFLAKTEGPDLPIILLTRLDDAAFGLRAVRAGAQDYLVKGQFDGLLLARAIRYSVERYRLRQDLVRKTSALLHSEARFHHMIEHNADSMIIVDESGRICFVNPAAEKLFGRPADELLGTSFGFPLVIEESTKIEIPAGTEPGPIACVEMQVAETSWDDQPAYLASLRDLTGRNQMEEALRRSQSEWQSTFNAMSDWVCLLDIETSRIIRTNRVGEAFTGLTAEELVGQTPCSSLHGSESPLALCPVQQMIQTGRREYAEFYRPAENEWVMITAEPVFDEQGELTSAVHITRDITARKQAELKLKDYSERLELMVAARTQELEDRLTELETLQEQLVRQEKLAVLGQMAGGVAHDLRNPIGVIKNALYYLATVLSGPEAGIQEALAMADQGTDSAERIIRTLLDFAGDRPPRRRAVDINNLLGLTAASLPDLPPEIELVWELEKDLPEIWVDPDQLGRVFSNLLENGFQAMLAPLEKKSGGRLTIKSALVEPGWVAVSIADTGVGIPPEERDKIFEPLFTRKAGGIGLGLALVRNVVAGHGGAIELESSVGQGSTFTVRLPLTNLDLKHR